MLLTKRPENIHRLWGHIEQDVSDGRRRDNVWLLTSVENQAAARTRIGPLLACDHLVPVLGLSCEPLLGPLDLNFTVEWSRPSCSTVNCHSTYAVHPLTGVGAYNGGAPHPRIRLVIAGGESGHGARPMHPDWVRSLRDQCIAADNPNVVDEWRTPVAFFFKQWGEWRPPRPGESFDTIKGRTWKPPAFLIASDGNLHCTRNAAGDGAVPMIHSGKKDAGRLLDGQIWDQMPETEENQS
jgi:protein gp37